MEASDFAGPSTLIAELASEINLLKKRITELETEHRCSTFSFKNILNDSMCKLYTGVPAISSFMALYSLFENRKINYYLGWNVDQIPKMDQLLMCLMKLRQNYPLADLAQRFGVSEDTVSNVVITWIHALHKTFKDLDSGVSARKKYQVCFTYCGIILDFTEKEMASLPSSTSGQEDKYSIYKHKEWKALVGVAPNGVVTYVSELYPTSVSDKKIVQSCGILNNVQLRDFILIDQGVLVEDLLPNGESINIPAFLETAHSTSSQDKQTETIDRAAYVVEIAKGRMKIFKILKFFPPSLIKQAGMIVQVIGSLTNFYPLIDTNEVQIDYSSEGE